MGRLRVTIVGLMAAIVVCATAFAALRTASDLWAGAFYTLTAVLLLVAVLAARFRRGAERAFWFGFAVFGWGFFLLGWGPWTDARIEEGEVVYNAHLLTTKLVLFLVPRLRKATDDPEAINQITANTLRISYLLTTLTLALVGGLIAVLMRRRGRVPSGRSGKTSRAVVPLAFLAVLVLAAASSGYFSRASPPFFPVAEADKGQALSRFEAKWFSQHLKAMGEPSLWVLPRRDRDATVYRLLLLPSFDHPRCVRIDGSGEGARLRVKVLDGRGGYEPGQVAIERSTTLARDRQARLERLLEEAAFWDLPTRIDDNNVCDGDQLIVEGVQGGKYHVVSRAVPEPRFARLCDYLLSLDGLKKRAAR